MNQYGRSVFLNVPFDRPYRKLFDALVFAVHSCGFLSRCALEAGDSSQIRLDKLYRIIAECGYGIHDLSRTTLDSKHRLPRFNMPLELGIFLGAKRYGRNNQRLKSCLILDRDRYRYQVFCSDISGQDVRAHGNSVETAIIAVRDWLRSERSSKAALPGGRSIAERYIEFRRDLPAMCRAEKLEPGSIAFPDYRMLVVGWLDTNPV
jgi:hypothetical protein